jgi:hypothetical protein
MQRCSGIFSFEYVTLLINQEIHSTAAARDRESFLNVVAQLNGSQFALMHDNNKGEASAAHS